jgi:hypothetical protein
MKRTLRPRDERGIVAIEFVLVGAPILLVLLFAITTVGGYIVKKTQATGAARDGARAAALSQPFPAPPAGVTVVRTSAACPPRTDPAFNTQNVVVRATSSFNIMLPGMGVKSITETVTMRCGG